jgi:hypothetical protein
MARATGVSQPHLHNILKGIRALPPELADQLLTVGGFNLKSLMEGGAPDTAGTGTANGVFELPPDEAMEPKFRAGDIIHYRTDLPARVELTAKAAYLVQFENRIVARYLRMGGQRLYLVSEASLRDPIRWDYVSLAGRNILEIVRGRIVWICRKVDAPETGAIEETGRDDRRPGGEG